MNVLSKYNIARPGFVLVANLFALISAVTSGLGAFNLLNNYIEPWPSIWIASAFTLIVQVTIVLLVFTLVQRISITVKLLTLVGYLVLVLASISTAAGMYWMMLRGNSYEQEVNQHRLNTVLAPLNNINTGVLSFSGMMSSVAVLANLRAEKEDLYGTSCERGVASGQGSRYDLRISHRDKANEYTKKATVLSDKIQSIISDASMSVIDTSVLQGAFNRANRVIQTAPIKSIETWATALSNGYKTAFVGAKKDGGDLSCPDPEMADKLDFLIKSINALPKLPDMPPVAKHVTTPEALLLSYKRMFFFFINDEPKEVSSRTSLDYLSLMPAAFIEFMIFILAHIRAAFIRKDGTGVNQVGSFLGGNGPMAGGAIESMERFLRLKSKNESLSGHTTIFDLLENYLMPLGPKTYLVVPIGKTDTAILLNRLVLLLNLHEESRPEEIVNQFPVDNLCAWFKELHEDGLKDINYTRLYPVKVKELNQWRRNTIRDYVRNAQAVKTPSLTPVTRIKT